MSALNRSRVVGALAVAVTVPWYCRIPFGAEFWRWGKGAAGTFDVLGFSLHLG